MKRTFYLIIVLMFGLLPKAFCQISVIQLTFTASYNGQYVPVDSILIENLTQGGDTVLFYPDTVLVLDNFATGMNEHVTSSADYFTLSQNYPNPFLDKTTFRIYLPQDDHMQISVFNLLGQTVARFENTLAGGIHAFDFYNGIDKNYILSVSAGGKIKSIKMAGLKGSTDKSCALVYSGKEKALSGYKSQKGINDFQFSPGDSLRFICYAKTTALVNGSDVIVDIPQSNNTYTFEILEGIPCQGIPEVIYQEKTYETLQIGSQCWFRENLNVGSFINISQSQTNNEQIEKYCYFNNESYCDTYGGLYQWNEMMQYALPSELQGICPEGWHIPSNVQFTGLVNILGGISVAGGKLKETGTAHWLSPNSGATNEVGFTALAAGAGVNGGFQYLMQGSVFWTSTETSSTTAWWRAIYYAENIMDNGSTTKTTGFSVRCMKD